MRFESLAWRWQFTLYWLDARLSKAAGSLTLAQATALVKGKAVAEIDHRYVWVQQRASPLRVGESVALTFAFPKLAAILHDRIWAGVTVWDTEAPLAVLAPTNADVQCLGMVFRASDGDKPIAPTSEDIARVLRRDPSKGEHRLAEAAAALRVAASANVNVLYADRATFKKRFRPGNREVLTAAIAQMPFIDEQALSWRQVLEIRRDSTARADLARFLAFIEDALPASSIDQLTDTLSARLHAYRQAMKKHGLKSKLAVVESVYDLRSKVLSSGTSAALAALGIDKTSAAAAGLALAIGDTAISLAKKKIEIDERREAINQEYSEVLFLANFGTTDTRSNSTLQPTPTRAT